MGWKELLGHSRSWAVIIGALFQVLIAAGVVVVGNDATYILDHAPYILAGLWTVFVLGKAYEDRVTLGDTSALKVWRSPGPNGGWWFALTKTLSDEAFVATLAGTVIAIVALCLPLWPGLGKFREVFIGIAYAVSVLAGVLAGGLKYSSAHAEIPPPASKPPDAPA